MLLTESRLAEVLAAHNPWWTSGAMPPGARHTRPRPRDSILVETPRPALLVGPRRCGKTAALLRAVDSHLRAGMSPRRIAYLPLDHPLLRLLPLGPLVDHAVACLEPSERPVVLLDSLQCVPEWPQRFLELVKTRPGPRFLATATVRPEVEDPSFDTVALPTLTFREFCDWRGVDDLRAPPIDLVDPHLPAEADATGDYFFDRVLDPALADYLVRGGFPEAVREPDLSVAQRQVRDEVVARAVYQDLPGVVGVMKLADVERVLLAGLMLNGHPIAIEQFADALDLDRQTVGRYLDHLERALLLTSLRNYAATTERSRPRVFPLDPALPNALLERSASVLAQPEERASLLVGAVVTHVEAAARARGLDVAYFRDGESEADVVVVTPEGAVPIVVLDREEISEEDAHAVTKLMKRVQGRHAFLLSRARPRRRQAITFFESVLHLPAAYFLYALRA